MCPNKVSNSKSVIVEIIKTCGDSLKYDEFKKIIESATLETFDENDITLTYENLSSHFCSEIIYNGKNYFTTDLGFYAINNKIHTSSNYENIKEHLITNKFFEYENFKNIGFHEKNGYSYYDPKLINKLNRKIDY